MAKSQEDTKGKKKSPAPLIGFVVVLVAVALMAMIYVNEQKRFAEGTQQTADSAVEEPAQEGTAPDAPTPPAATEPTAPTPESAPTEAEAAPPAEEQQAPATETGAGDEEALQKLITPRVLGDPNSPLEIREHSSFSCGHCKHFHETNFKEIKKDYIDTGKAHIVFDDFPRNVVDLAAGVVARCVPDAAYFNYIQLLFETQDEWAFKGEHLEYLKQNAKLIGLTDEQVDTCLANQKLQDALAQSAQTANQKHGVGSTPTLVLNDKIVIPGLTPYEELKKTFDAELEKSSQKPK